MHKIVCCIAFWAAASGFAADLPVTEVTLYKNGIGYFVRSGELKPGESAGLRFKAEEMNDVLKSLTIFEDGSGKVSGLRYDSSELLNTKLARFPFRDWGPAAAKHAARSTERRAHRDEDRTGHRGRPAHQRA